MSLYGFALFRVKHLSVQIFSLIIQTYKLNCFQDFHKQNVSCLVTQACYNSHNFSANPPLANLTFLSENVSMKYPRLIAHEFSLCMRPIRSL